MVLGKTQTYRIWLNLSEVRQSVGPTKIYQPDYNLVVFGIWGPVLSAIENIRINDIR